MVEPNSSPLKTNNGSSQQQSSTTSQSTIPIAVDTLTSALNTLYLNAPSSPGERNNGTDANSSSPSVSSIWIEFSENIEVIINNCYFTQIKGIREYWTSETKRDEAGSMEILQLIHDLMTASQRTLLPAAVYALADTTDYDITVPIDILWEGLCTEPFSSWVREKAAYDPSIQFPQHVLIYTDETYTKTKTGLFLYEKVELMLNTLYISVRDFILSLLGQTSSSTSKGGAGGNGGETNMSSSSSSLLHNNNNVDGDDQRRIGGDMVEVRYTLDRFLRDNGWLWALFKTATLSEVYFNSATVVFRPKPNTTTTTDTAPSSSIPASSIQLREYGAVPLGDLQTLLPAKTILLPPIDTILFITQVSMILLFLQYGVEEVGDSLGETATSGWDSVVIAALLVAGLLSRLVTLVTGYIGTVRYYENVIEKWLEGKRSGRNESALFKISTRVVAQEVKEVLLGYFYLWRFGPLTAHDLRRRVNSFLTIEFGVINADFDVRDSLSKLQKLGLVTTTTTPVEKGAARSDGQDTPGSSPQLYRVNITPRDWLRAHTLQHLKGVSLR